MRVCDRCGAKHAVRLVVAMGAWEPFTNPSLGNADLCNGCATKLREMMAEFLPECQAALTAPPPNTSSYVNHAPAIK